MHIYRICAPEVPFFCHTIIYIASHRIASHAMPSSDFILSYKLLNAYSFRAFSPLQILQWNRIANLESRVFTKPYARRSCCCCCSLKSCSTTSRVHQIQALLFHIFIFSIYIICTLHTQYSLVYVHCAAQCNQRTPLCVCVIWWWSHITLFQLLLRSILLTLKFLSCFPVNANFTKCIVNLVFRSLWSDMFFTRAHHQPFLSAQHRVQCVHTYFYFVYTENCLYRQTNGNIAEPHV